jgi:hypothetical protein
MKRAKADNTSCGTSLLDLPVDMIRVILRGINDDYWTLLEIMSCLSKNWYQQMKKEWSEIRVMETAKYPSLSQKRVVRMTGLNSLRLSMNKKITDIVKLTQLTSLDLSSNDTTDFS